MKLCIFLLGLAALRADVVDSAANGFTVKSSWTIKAAPDIVYQRIVHHVGDWWNPAHTFSGDSHNLSIDAKAGGCFCEKLPGGGGVRHLELVYIVPGKALRMIGALGPFQAMGVNGAMSIVLTPVDGSTRLDLTYTIGGYMEGGLHKMAAAADGMLKEQFTRLQHYTETGVPEEGRK